MIKTAKQLKDLIRNLSKAKAADAQLLMRNYMMERFLERISLSELGRDHQGRDGRCGRSRKHHGRHRFYAD